MSREEHEARLRADEKAFKAAMRNVGNIYREYTVEQVRKIIAIRRAERSDQISPETFAYESALDDVLEDLELWFGEAYQGHAHTEKMHGVVALCAAAARVRNGEWYSGAPSHVFAELLNDLEENGWRLTRVIR